MITIDENSGFYEHKYAKHELSSDVRIELLKAAKALDANHVELYVCIN